MIEDPYPRPSEAAADETPTWLRALQAGAIGLIAGLVLHAIIAVVVVQAGSADPAHAGPKECKKSSPARDTGAPPTQSPAVTSLRWTAL